MRKLRDDLYSIDRDVDLVFSSDDGGWYLQKYLHNDEGDTKISCATFSTKENALREYKAGKIVWES